MTLSLTNANNIELETALQKLSFDLRCDTVETNMAPRVHRLLRYVSLLRLSHGQGTLELNFQEDNKNCAVLRCDMWIDYVTKVRTLR
jgi:hypothetical protein